MDNDRLLTALARAICCQGRPCLAREGRPCDAGYPGDDMPLAKARACLPVVEAHVQDERDVCVEIALLDTYDRNQIAAVIRKRGQS